MGKSESEQGSWSVMVESETSLVTAGESARHLMAGAFLATQLPAEREALSFTSLRVWNRREM